MNNKKLLVLGTVGVVGVVAVLGLGAVAVAFSKQQEKKFDEFATVFQLINYGITELYHVTLKNNVKNIFKKGLKPKSADNKEGYREI